MSSPKPSRSSKSPRHEPTYIAVIGDIVASRKLTSARRREVQIAFGELINRMNKVFAADLRAKFTIALGDEFEGLLSTREAHQTIPDLIWIIDNAFTGPLMRLGIGLGAIDTEIPEYAASVDGPAFHRGREAIGLAAKKGRMGGVFRGFSDNQDTILNGLARVLHHQRNSWSRQQRKVASLLRTGENQKSAAHAMNLSKQAVSAYTRAAGWDAYQEGEDAFRKAIEEALDKSTRRDNSQRATLS